MIEVNNIDQDSPRIGGIWVIKIHSADCHL